MTILSRLRERWGGGIRPEVSIDHHNTIERWDGEGDGPGKVITFEGFGITGSLWIGRTPRRRA